MEEAMLYASACTALWFGILGDWLYAQVRVRELEEQLERTQVQTEAAFVA